MVQTIQIIKILNNIKKFNIHAKKPLIEISAIKSLFYKEFYSEN
jgi:hypothetical protein